MSRSVADLCVDLSAYYRADEPITKRSTAPGVVRAEDIEVPEAVRIALAKAPSIRYGRCPKCQEQTDSVNPCCGIDPWEDGE